MTVLRRISVAAVMTASLVLGGCGTLDAVKQFWSDDEPIGSGVQAEQTPRVQIRIDGIEGRLADNVRALLAIAAEPCDAPRWRLEREFARSDEDVRRALRALGHYRPVIRKTFTQVENCWLASYDIEAGPQVVFGKLDVRVDGEASTDARFTELLAALPIASGDPLDHGRYEGLKSAIESLAAERGYFDGTFTLSELRVDVEAGRADVMLRYDSGKRYRIGRIDVHQDAFNEDLIDRLTSLRPGMPYDSTRLAAQNRSYTDSGYFSAVDISPRLREARQAAARADTAVTEPSGDERASGTGDAAQVTPRSVPVDITLTPRPKHSYTAGLGFSTDVGPRLRLGYENRRLNRAGHRWNADLTAAPRESEFNLGYRVPLADPRTDWLTFQAGFRFENAKTFETRTTHLGVNRTGTRFGWLETQSLDVTRDAFIIGAEDSTTLLVVPGISWQKVVADDPLRPTRGWSALLELRGTHTAVSDTSFIQARSRTSAVYGLPWDDRLLGRVEVGATAVTDFSVLPPTYRFFAGGDTSIRGYAFEELGPKDAQDRVVGGRYLLVGSLEYEHALNDKWSIATFVDAGNAYDKFKEGVKVGVGAGIRWQTPVGPLRVDLGVPLRDKSTLFRVHVRFGPDL